MTTKHTQGPWRRIGHRQIATTVGAGLPVCEVWSGGVGNEQADANECLIVAAPDLLEALQAALAYNDAVTASDGTGQFSWAPAARAAIAKAKGEQARSRPATSWPSSTTATSWPRSWAVAVALASSAGVLPTSLRAALKPGASHACTTSARWTRSAPKCWHCCPVPRRPKLDIPSTMASPIG